MNAVTGPQPTSAAADDDAALDGAAFALWNAGRQGEAIAILERQIARAGNGGVSGGGPAGLSGAASATFSLPRVDFWEHWPNAADPPPDDQAASPAHQPGAKAGDSVAPAAATPAMVMTPAKHPASGLVEVPAPTARRGRWRPGLRALRPAAALLLVLFVAAGLWVGSGLRQFDLERPPNPRPSVLLEAADGTPMNRTGGSYAGPVARADIPDHLIKAVLVTEDRRFYQHFGIDLLGVGRAAWRNLQAGEIVEGGSTITQQLAKVLFLNPEQTLRRKLQEAAIAIWLDLKLSKDEIITRYLDSIYFGAGATGISAAAQIYFDKPVAELDLAQSAMLAGLIRSPSRLNPLTDLPAARKRAATVLNTMVDAGSVSRADALAAVLIPASPVRSTAIAQTGSWFGDWVAGSATGAMGPLKGAARIRTTLQPRLQAIAENAVRTALDRQRLAGRAAEAALVAMTPDGAVVAMVGGRSYDESQFNRAVDTLRPPGAAFSVAVYLAALRLGWDLGDTILDTPLATAAGTPSGASEPEGARVTLEAAFAGSRQAATARLAQDVGLETVIRAARDLGVDAELDVDPSIALGGAAMSLLDLTGAYASIASGRVPLQPWAVARVSEDAGAELSSRTGGAGPKRDLAHRDELTRLLAASLRQATGGGLGKLAVGKAGVSEESRDGWFIGFSDGLIAGVWVGKDDNSPLDAAAAEALPTGIWRNFMTKATGADPLEPEPEEAPQPAVVAVSAEEDASAAPAAKDASRPAVGNAGAPPEAETQIARGSPQAEQTLPAPPPAAVAPSAVARMPAPRPAREPAAAPTQPPEPPAAAQPAIASLPPAAEAPPTEPPAVRVAPTPTRRAVRNPPPPAVVRRTPQRGLRESDRPRVLLGGRGLPGREAVSGRDRGRRAADGPQVLLGGRGLP